VPPYLVIPADGLSAVYGKPVVQATYMPARLVKVIPPLRLRWGFSGAAPDGWLVPGPATIRVFGAALSSRTGQCLSVDIRTPFEWHGKWSLSSDGTSKQGRLGGDGLARVEMPLRRLASGAPFQDVTLRGLGKPVTLVGDGRKATVRIAALDTKPCG
jgi:hypothetical protein